MISKENTKRDIGYQIESDNIPILSFFTGAGFLDIGFANAGFHSIWRNEYNRNFIKGFEYGMKALMGIDYDNRIHNTGSIVEVGPNQIIREAFGTSIPKGIFGIIGGPPCPDFSVGGKNRGREGDNGKLSQVYTNRILELQPTFFLFENVPGLLRTEKHRLFFESIKNQLSEDFLLDYRILNALDFGVPQDRERVFLVGLNKKWAKKNGYTKALNANSEWFHWPSNSRYKDAKIRFDWPTSCPFGETPERPPNIPEELMVGSYLNDIEALMSLPNGNEYFNPSSDKFNTVAEGDVSRKSFKRLHRWRFSPTAAYGNNEVHLHPFFPRRLTVREAMKIQTVPDGYVLPSNMPLSHKFKTIGNGVPVKLAYEIALSFRKLFMED